MRFRRKHREENPPFAAGEAGYVINPRALRNLGVAALVAGSTLGVQSLNSKSGETLKFTPTPENIQKRQIDDELKLLVWNMHNVAGLRYQQLLSLGEQHNIDAMLLQEVNVRDFELLQKRMKRWYLTMVVADAVTAKTFQGGFGNVIATRQKPDAISAFKMKGTEDFESVRRTITGIYDDIAGGNTAWKHTKDGRQEGRAVLALNIKTSNEDGEDQTVRIMNTHIAGLPIVHDKQFQQLKNIAKDEIKDSQPTILCGDFNTSATKVATEFGEELGMLRLDRGGGEQPTSLGGRVIDHCVARSFGKLSLGSVNVLKEPSTDHHPLIASWKITRTP